MKRILGFLMALIVCLGVFPLVGGVNPVKAASTFHATSDQLRGYSYAVYDAETKTLTLFRSTTGYNNYGAGSAVISRTDLNGKVHTGVMWQGFDSHGSMSFSYWSSKDIERVVMEPNNAIRPRRIDSWFENQHNLKYVDLSYLDTSQISGYWGSHGMMMNTFRGCSSLESLDISMWDLTSVEAFNNMFSGCTALRDLHLPEKGPTNAAMLSGMFQDCSSLKAIDLSNFVVTPYASHDGGFLVNVENLFAGCSALEEVDISGLDTRNNARVGSYGPYWSYTGFHMFDGCNALAKITFGSNFDFSFGTYDDGPALTKQYLYIPDSPTGYWSREDIAFGPYTPEELAHAYTSAMAGTWVWGEALPRYELIFSAGNSGSGSMPNVMLPVEEDGELPANQFFAFGYEFDHWDDGNGHTYEDKATIPANTYQEDQKVTLTAVFKKRDTSLNWNGNEAEFSIRAGEQAVLDNIPAGTSYHVYERTPDGWVLVQQENANGVIEALEESSAAFWNKYQPDIVTVQFTGTKKLDGRPAKAGSYQFELLDENRNVIQTKSVVDGGFIQFDPIEYTKDDLGEHTYIIKEIDSHDESIDYDVHEETVKVLVKQSIVHEGMTVHSYTDNLNESGEKESDYISGTNYGDVITIPGAEKLHVTVKYTNPRGYFWIWQGDHDEVYSGPGQFSGSFNNSSAMKSYTYQSGKDQEYLTDEFDVEGDSLSVMYSSYAYPQDNANYSDMVNYGYYMTVSSSVTGLAADVTYDEDGVSFNNTTRPGILRITKDAQNVTDANTDDEFTLEIEFRNESGMPINDDIYWYVEGGATIPAEISDSNQE